MADPPSNARRRWALLVAALGLAGLAAAAVWLRPNARFMLAVCRDRRGDPAAGRRELDLARRLTPAPEMRATLEKWYAQLTR
jgi:hypothetical protein